MGRAIATALASAGADLVGVSASQEPDGGAVGNDVRSLGREFRAYTCDFRNRDETYEFVRSVRRDAGPIDILVNNAGMVAREPAAEHRDTYWDGTLEVNLSAPFILARELGREMLERGSGKIIFIASMLSFQGGITVPSYAASKGGIAQLTKAFANEWASRGVNVNAIAPGYIRTDNTSALVADTDRNRQILERIPAARWGEPDDVQGAAVFLASGASDYVHGTVLTVDGGWMGR